MKRTGTINWISYGTRAEPVEEERGQIVCDCCKARGLDSGVDFFSNDLPAGEEFGPHLLNRRVRYDLVRVNGQPQARKIQMIPANAPAECR
jgi:hypothetical protein